jgi:hypothetical protein
LWQVFRKNVRPRLLNVDHGIVNQDLLWQFRDAGLENVQINGHLTLFSTGDDRLPVEDGQAYALASYKAILDRTRRWRKDYGAELAAAGFSDAEFEELIALKQARYDYLKEDPARIREVMEVYSDPLIFVRGRRPEGD